MRIPKHFELNGYEWRVEYKWSLKDDTGVRCDGLCDPTRRVIYLDKLMTRTQKFSTFLHEFIHAVFSEAHISDSGLFKDGAEEIACRALELKLQEYFTIRWKRR